MLLSGLARSGLVRAAIIIAVLVALEVLGAVPAAAWTQLRNRFPDAPMSCTGVPPTECIRWKKTSAGTSITVQVFLESSLDNVTSVNMKAIARNSMAEWNGVPAFNPFFREWTDPSNVWEVTVDMARLSDEGQCYFGITDTHWRDDSPYRIYNSEVHLNSTISWNDSLAFGVINTSDGPICRADARKVMTHEIGHAQGLGHTGVDPAVMRQGGTTYWRPQPNDKDGLQAIYGAAP